LKNHSALILGAGDTGELVVRHLRDRGIGQLRVSNRSAERGRDLAARFEGDAVAWENVEEALEWPDMVVSSVSSAEPVLTRAVVERAMAERGNRALLLIDLGVPRNVEPGVAGLYNVYLYNIDDLQEIVAQNKRARAAEIPRAEAIVGEHVDKFLIWQAGVNTSAVLAGLRVRLEAEREAFLAARLGDLAHLPEADRARVGRLLEEFLDQVLLDPVERLRGERELRRKLQNLEALRDLFRLDQGKP
jgi:glutamyl-tRNA reductase